MKTPGLVLHLFRRAARLQRKRMALTVAAIAWGTISIVLLLSFGEGMKRAMRKGQHGLGEGIMVVWPGETSKAFAGMPQGRAIQLLPEDVELLRRSVPAVGRASGEMRRWGVSIGYGRKLFNKPVVGVEPIWGEMRAQVPEPGGRFINAVDERLKRRVVFVGADVADELFGKDAKLAAVGETILVNQVPFTVVGIMQKKIQMGMYGGPDVNTLVIPLSTFRTFFGRRHLGNLVFDPVTPERMEEARKGMFATFGAKYKFDPEDERALGLWDTQKNQKTMQNMTLGIQLFLGIIGALTLLIGGVGVANIMYAAVKARSREIAIQMALGARKVYVMGPLVLESLALTLLGGAIGTLAGVGIVEGLALLQRKAQNEAMQFMGEPTFSPAIALATVAILGTVGFLAGYFPSRRAVTIHPAATLRHE